MNSLIELFELLANDNYHVLEPKVQYYSLFGYIHNDDHQVLNSIVDYPMLCPNNLVLGLGNIFLATFKSTKN